MARRGMKFMAVVVGVAMAIMSAFLVDTQPSSAAETPRPAVWRPPDPPLPSELKCKEAPKVESVPAGTALDFWIEFCRSRIGQKGNKFYFSWGGFGLQTLDATKPAAVYIDSAVLIGRLGAITIREDCLEKFQKKYPPNGSHWEPAPLNLGEIHKVPCTFLHQALDADDPWTFEMIVVFRRGSFGPTLPGPTETLQLTISPNE